MTPLEIVWNRALIAWLALLTAAVMIAIICNMDKWIWRK